MTIEIDPTPARPQLGAVAAWRAEVTQCFEQVGRARQRWVNRAGADAYCGDSRLLTARVASYGLASELVGQAGPAPIGTRYVDVGAGVGAFSAWVARRLGLPATLVDTDADVRSTAARAWPDIDVQADTTAVPDGAGWLVTAMEVLEHVAYEDQPEFVRELVRLVAPGGLLVLSTPDESSYRGGWSGYGPHIGVVDAVRLRELLEEASGHPAQVWRLEGPPFDVGPLRAVVLPIANRLHTWSRAVAPGLLDRLSDGVLRTRSGVDRRRERPETEVRIEVVDARHGRGSGLVGVVHRGPVPLTTSPPA